MPTPATAMQKKHPNQVASQHDIPGHATYDKVFFKKPIAHWSSGGS
jgi:hypothetical protein